LPATTSQDRADAAGALNKVLLHSRTTDQVLHRVKTPFARDLLFGSLRYYCTLSQTVNQQLDRALRSKDHDLWCLMIVGAYQLIHTRVPDHAAIHATVQACNTLGKPWARGLLNGVLRSVQRAPEQLFEPADYYPAWFAEIIMADYPNQARDLLAANLERAPQALRVNANRISTAELAALLTERGIASKPGLVSGQLLLEEPISADQLPGFSEGLVTIQDAGAGFAPQLLALQPGQRLLATCAAPGGKLFHLLEVTPALGHAVAVESSPARAQHLRDESARLGHSPCIIEADARDLAWWDGNLFDAILVDAPCSGSGTLRRHPEMKLLRTAEDIEGYQVLQTALLESAWRTLRPGASLLYCTCSMFFAENDHVIGAFLAHTQDARNRPIVLPTGIATQHGWQLLPTDPRTVGFYYALLTKKGETNQGLRKQPI
jgi:16S rRNA (cytosine967-C5)-methyltransferase